MHNPDEPTIIKMTISPTFKLLWKVFISITQGRNLRICMTLDDATVTIEADGSITLREKSKP